MSPSTAESTTMPRIFWALEILASLSKKSFISVAHAAMDVELVHHAARPRAASMGVIEHHISEEDGQLQPLEELGHVVVRFGDALDRDAAVVLVPAGDDQAPRIPARVVAGVGVVAQLLLVLLLGIRGALVLGQDLRQ